MARTFEHSIPISVNMGPLDRALVGYYAHRFRKNKSAIIRGMVRKYARSDTNFDADAFLEYVDKELVPNETKSEAEGQSIKTQAKLFASGKKSGETLA